MPTISGVTPVIAAGGSIQNLLLGSQYELAPFDGTIEIGLMADQAGGDVSIFSGPDTLQEPGGLIPFSGTALTLTYPKYPDDYHWEDEVAHGDRLKISVRNTSGANMRVAFVLRITPA